MNKKPNPQNGSVFFLIFLAIGLFAAMSYAVFQGSRGGNASLTKEQSKLAAQEIIAFADSVGSAVNKLRLAGCLETQLNFENIPTGATFDNASAPSDGSCDIFSISGGAVNYTGLAANYQTSSGSGHYKFNSQSVFQGTGTSSNDLTLWVDDLTKDICDQANRIINGIDATAEAMGTHTQNFTGSFASTIAGGVGDDVGSAYAGKAAGCIYKNSTSYSFYRVLIAR